MFAKFLARFRGNRTALQDNALETVLMQEVGSGELEGTLLLPAGVDTVALLIAGSGPTDRNGNNARMINDHLKLLAYALAGMGVASLRYDKRGVGASSNARVSEESLRFEHLVDDAKHWISRLKADSSFEKVIVIGHSEGSLIGMIAAKESQVDKFVSIAGIGRPLYAVLDEQLDAVFKNSESLRLEAKTILDHLIEERAVPDVNEELLFLFRPSVQPYLISSFRLDPQAEIAKLDIPVLIVQGTADIQVTEEDAQLLSAANTNAEISYIEGMNHILKAAVENRDKNIATYNQPKLPVSQPLVDRLSKFVNE